MLSKMNFYKQDDRVRKYLLPEKILLTKGNVQNPETLLKKKPLQIFTDEPDRMTLKNGDSGENAAVLLDFGIEFSGGVRILTGSCFGNKNPRIRLTFGESANEALSEIGVKNATNDHSNRDFEAVLSSSSDMEFAQTGYRFLKIELLEKNSEIFIPAVLGVFTYRDLPYLGTFECSDPLLTEIYNVCAYTCHLNMQTMLWDGIKRDRLVWIGDMHPEMLTIRTVFGYDFCIEQGLEYSIQKSPLPGYSNHMVTYSMWWLLILRDWYLHNGRAEYILSRADYIRDLLSQLCELIREDGSDSIEKAEGGYFLDWPGANKPQSRAGVRALFSLALRAGAELCEIIAADDKSELYLKSAAHCREKADILDRFIPEIYDSKPSAALMRLANQLDTAQAEEVLLRGGTAGMSTFMSYYILSALAAGGNTRTALKFLTEYYGGMLAAGATTFWEDFDLSWLCDGARIDKISEPGEYNIHADNGAHCYQGFRHSLCHGWASGPTAFLAEQVLGITIAEPGCKAIKISPDLGELTWAKGTYPTPFGTVTVSHTRRDDGSIQTKIQAPEEIRIV